MVNRRLYISVPEIAGYNTKSANSDDSEGGDGI